MNSGTLTLTDVNLSGNDAGFRGGGIVDQGGDVQISGGTLRATPAAAPALFERADDDHRRDRLEQQRGGQGGGIYVGGGSLTITDTAVTGNYASSGRRP